MWCEGLTFEQWEDKYDHDEEVMQYLHGKCHEWVNKHYQIGDTCIAILEEREGIDTMCLLHSCLLRDESFIDVRGETRDFNDIIEAFDYGDFEIVAYDNLEGFNDLMK